MEITVGELIEKLQEYPKDYKIAIDRHYWSDGDYDYGWNNQILTDIDSVNQDDEHHRVELEIYE